VVPQADKSHQPLDTFLGGLVLLVSRVFISKKSLDSLGRVRMGYVSKVTSAGQLTIPKKIRVRLGLGASSFVVLDEVGDVVLLRRFEADEESLRILRRRFRKTGLTRARVNEIVERERARLWKEAAKGIR
jgi:AbrB family looped-hinge helix DNA binding protein